MKILWQGENYRLVRYGESYELERRVMIRRPHLWWRSLPADPEYIDGLSRELGQWFEQQEGKQ